MSINFTPHKKFSFPLVSQQSRIWDDTISHVNRNKTFRQNVFKPWICFNVDFEYWTNRSPSLNLIIIYYSFLVYKAPISCWENLFIWKEHWVNKWRVEMCVVFCCLQIPWNEKCEIKNERGRQGKKGKLIKTMLIPIICFILEWNYHKDLFLLGERFINAISWWKLLYVYLLR